MLLSTDPDFFDHVRSVSRNEDRFVDTVGNVHCDGSVAPLTNINPVIMDHEEWSGGAGHESTVPDPRTMPTLLFDCRPPEWVDEVGALSGPGA